ncbi:MAG TPA: M42 family metallopeptidase [Candidatus Eisenbacteria bacterium]|nr:M42 family metallopeptidase [Candidatus Eisenbacteria bacterium]
MRRTLPAFLFSAILAAVSPAQSPSNDPLLRLMKQFTEAPGPPGAEGAVRKLFTESAKPYADKISYDGLGSVIAQQGNTGPRIMVDAHMDELGAIVRHIRPDGYITVQMLGYWLPQALGDQRWTIIGSKGPVLAVSELWDAHIAPHDAGRPTQPTEYFFDTGARSAAEVAALGISVGDPIAPVSEFAVLPNNRYLAKAWDDRVGCIAMIEAMRRLKSQAHPNQIFYAATIQEEGSIEMRGATTSAHIINPDIGIALEVGVANDTPGNKPDASLETIGGGPGIMLYSFSEYPNRKLVKYVQEVAAEKQIPLQFDFVQGFGDDAGAIKLNGSGVPVTTLLVPTRSTHTHNGIIDRSDFDRTVDLLVTLLQRLDAATVAKIRSFDPADDSTGSR